MIILITDKGSIELEAASGACMGCNRHGGGMANLTIHDVDFEKPVVARLCGNCVAGGLGQVIKAKLDRTRGSHEFELPAE